MRLPAPQPAPTPPGSAPPTAPSPLHDRWVLTATLVAALVRLPGLFDRPLWMDEALQLTVSHAPDLLRAMRTEDLHPPLFSALLSLLPADASDAAHRLPSWLASVASVPLAALAAQRWSGPHAARWAACLCAALPVWVLYAGEARPYALGMCAVLAMLHAARGPHPLALLLAGAAAIFTQYGAWPVVAIALLLAPPSARPRPAALALLALAAALTVALALPQHQHQALDLRGGYLGPWFWSPAQALPFTARRLPELFGYLLTGARGTASLGVGAALLLLTLRAARRDRLTALALAPVAVFWCLAGLGLHPFGGLRQLLVLAPGLVLLASARLGPATPARLTLVGALGLLLTARHPGPPTEDLPCLITQLDDAPRLADASARFGLDRYDRLPHRALPWRSGDTLAALTPLPAERTWLITTSARRDALGPLLDRWRASGGELGRTPRCAGVEAIELLPP